jgi:hypothetical protein
MMKKMSKEKFMDREKLQFFIQNKYDKKEVIVDEWYETRGGWELQIIWRTPDIPILDTGTSISDIDLKEYMGWLSMYLRTKKIKKICSKLVTK